MNGRIVRAWLKQMLAPLLRPDDVVIMDNLGCHNAAAIREAIEARGATLLHLPPNSPDLNPIEQAFASLEALLRKGAARTVAALWDTLGKLIDRFAPAERANFLAHAGYGRSA